MIRKLFVILLSSWCVSSFAQQNMTLYQMHNITQSNSLNPSVASDCRWNIGFPVLGNISFAVGIPIAYDNLGTGNDALSGDELLSLMKKNNLFSTNLSLNILTIGYRAGSTYYQFTMNEKASVKASFSKAPVELLIKGNAAFSGQTIEGNVGLSLLAYREYALNIAHDFGDDTWFGARAKLMFGRVGALSTNNTLSLYTDPNTYALDLSSDLLLRASIPGTMEIDPNDNTVDGFNSELEAKHFIFNPVNMGGAIDLGMNKTLESGWKVSASILNIGIINWNNDVHTLAQRSKITYSGPTSGINNWGDFTDTLKSIANFNYKSGEAYSQWLSPVIMAGANYPVAEYLRLGVTGYAEISPVGVPWAITATALTDNLSNVYGALSYTVTNNSFVNIGAGIGVRVGAFNIHAITDNLIALFNPFSQKYATVQFGINFKFGCGDGDSDGKSKKYRSIPCPSYGHSNSSGLGSIPCPSGKR